jgi:hypothetical protein
MTSSMERQQRHAYTIIKTLAFPPDEWIWTLEPVSQCGPAKGGGEALFSFALGVLFMLRAREHENAKKPRAPTSAYL